MKIMVLNEKTGEVKETEIICPFATQFEPKRESVHDGEDYEPGTSVTTLEGYEPLESIVARCMRTMKTPNGATVQVLDTDALKAEETQQGVYDAAGAHTVDEAFATMDPTESQGFDLADASQIQNSLSERLAQTASDETSSNLSTKGTSAPLNSEVSDVVGKSESMSETDAFPENRNSNISNSDKGK